MVDERMNESKKRMGGRDCLLSDLKSTCAIRRICITVALKCPM